MVRRVSRIGPLRVDDHKDFGCVTALEAAETMISIPFFKVRKLIQLYLSCVDLARFYSWGSYLRLSELFFLGAPT